MSSLSPSGRNPARTGARTYSGLSAPRQAHGRLLIPQASFPAQPGICLQFATVFKVRFGRKPWSISSSWKAKSARSQKTRCPPVRAANSMGYARRRLCSAPVLCARHVGDRRKDHGVRSKRVVGACVACLLARRQDGPPVQRGLAARPIVRCQVHQVSCANSHP